MTFFEVYASEEFKPGYSLPNPYALTLRDQVFTYDSTKVVLVRDTMQ